MLRLVDRGADLGDAAGDAGRGLIVHDAYRLDPMLAVCGELLGDLRRIDAMPPIACDELDVEPEPGRHLPPQCREMAGLEHPPHTGDDLLAEIGEFLAAMIDRREGDGMQNTVGHVGRPGNLQEMAAGMAERLIFHRFSFPERSNRGPVSVAGKQPGDKPGTMPQPDRCRYPANRETS